MRHEFASWKGNNNLANVNVGAPLVNLRVVGVKKSSVYASFGLDAIAGISIPDNVGRLAVFSYDPETDTLAWVELGTVHHALINDGKLVTKNSYQQSWHLITKRQRTSRRCLLAKCCRSSLPPSRHMSCCI
jgi:hypothetical protein